MDQCKSPRAGEIAQSLCLSHAWSTEHIQSLWVNHHRKPRQTQGVHGGVDTRQLGELLRWGGCRGRPLELKLPECRIVQYKWCPSKWCRNYMTALLHLFLQWIHSFYHMLGTAQGPGDSEWTSHVWLPPLLPKASMVMGDSIINHALAQIVFILVTITCALRSSLSELWDHVTGEKRGGPV